MLTLLLCFVAFMYLGAPLIILATQRQAAKPQLQFYGLELRDPGYAYLVQAAWQIQRLGFELVGYFGWVGQTTNVNAFIAYLVHRQSHDGALAVMARSKEGAIRTQFVEFSTRFVDGSSITTGNSKVMGVYLRPRFKPVYHFPWINDPARLYQLHLQLMWRDRPTVAKEVVQPGKEQERLCDGLRREMQDQVAPGILRLDSARAFYRPTLKGAYLMSWKVLPPVKQIRAILRKSRAEKLEKMLSGARTPAPIHPHA